MASLLESGWQCVNVQEDTRTGDDGSGKPMLLRTLAYSILSAGSSRTQTL